MQKNRWIISMGFAVLFVLLLGDKAGAWNGGKVTLSAGLYDSVQYQQKTDATIKNSELVSVIGSDEQVHQMRAVVTKGHSVRLAQLSGEARWAIAIGTDAVYRYLDGFRWQGPTLITGTNKMAMPLKQGDSGWSVAISDDITKDVQPVYGWNHQIIRYSLDVTKLRYWLSYTDSNHVQWQATVYNEVFSANKRYAVFWLNWAQFVRVDFYTGTSIAFMNRAGAWYDGVYGARASAITNDGRYVFMNDGSSVVDIQPSCGFTINPATFSGKLDGGFINCPERQIDPTEVAGYNAKHSEFYLSPDEQSASYVLSQFPFTTGNYETKEITMKVESTAHRHLKYLALGDSYSSGEGDTEINPTTGKKYYLDHTDDEGSNDQPREKCHLSSRSYPFLLASYMGVRDSMQSVACSGAVIDDLKGDGEYFGQKSGSSNSDNAGRLSGFNSVLYQDEAREKYVPGRIRQIDFLRKATPDVITVTSGGNDANFSEIIKACINVGLKELLASSCHYANENEGRATLKGLISQRYEPLRKLYVDIHNASPNSKIYVLGYPRFVNDSVNDDQCGANVRLNKAERIMIKESVNYMNTIIEHAARAAGVKYVDVSSALSGHELCDNKANESSNYVTGIASKGASEIQESYHPNDVGHALIATAFKKSLGNVSPLEYSYCEDGTSMSSSPFSGHQF